MRPLIRAAARLLTGSAYVLLGADAVRAPGGRVGLAAPTLARVRQWIPVPEDDELLVRGNAALQVACGGLLALNRLTPLAALSLAGSLVPTTIAGHAFWTVEDPAARKQQLVQFVKNTAMIGGLLAIAADQSATD